MDMIGLCHSCHTSNMEISIVEGFNVCEKCMIDPKIVQVVKQLKWLTKVIYRI